MACGAKCRQRLPEGWWIACFKITDKIFDNIDNIDDQDVIDELIDKAKEIDYSKFNEL